MTCIAYKDGILAADKQSTLDGMRLRSTKIARIRSSLFGGSGDAQRLRELRLWVEYDGRTPYPEWQRSSIECNPFLLIGPDGTIQLYERSPAPLPLEQDFIALGTGAAYAMAAMHCGKSAEEAVVIASLFDVHTGNGVDTLKLA